MNRMLNAGALIALSTLCLPLSALAQEGAIFANRTACLDRAETLPDFAYEEAKLWERQGAGVDARLCQALALMLRGDWEQAAPALETVAAEMVRERPPVRANLLSRAGTAWSNAHKLPQAEAAFGKALELTPRDPQILMDRAIARAGMERYWEVIADLDKVLELAPKMAEAWLLRAQAHHLLALDGKSMNDVEEALRLSPQSGEALLLRGNLRAAKSDMVRAKQDWESVRRVAAGTSAANIALQNLNALDRAQTDQKRELKKKTEQ
jgi:tetratricopeptide (TPR) repeat protein